MTNPISAPVLSQHQLRDELEAMVLGDLLGLAAMEKKMTIRTVGNRFAEKVTKDFTPRRGIAKKPPFLTGGVERSAATSTGSALHLTQLLDDVVLHFSAILRTGVAAVVLSAFSDEP